MRQQSGVLNIDSVSRLLSDCIRSPAPDSWDIADVSITLRPPSFNTTVEDGRGKGPLRPPLSHESSDGIGDMAGP